MAIEGMVSEMGKNAAGVQQGVRRGVGAEARLDDDIETAVTPNLQAVAPHYPKAQRQVIVISIIAYLEADDA